jgi:stage IV sporulation protein FB
MFGSGYLNLGRVAGARVRAHWTLPVGALVFGGGRLSLGYFAGFVLLVLVHEVGHAVVVRQRGHHATSLELHGMGGLCRWRGDPTALDVAWIAWGGVLAEALLFLATLGATAVFGMPSERFFAELVSAFIWTNLWMLGINLLPIPPLDGAEAWKLFPLLRRRAQARAAERRLRQRHAARRELAKLEAAERRGPAPEVAVEVEGLVQRLAREAAEGKDSRR